MVSWKRKEDNTKMFCNVHCLFVLPFLFSSAIRECSNYGVGMMSLEHWLENLSMFHTTGECANDLFLVFCDVIGETFPLICK